MAVRAVHPTGIITQRAAPAAAKPAGASLVPAALRAFTGRIHFSSFSSPYGIRGDAGASTTGTPRMPRIRVSGCTAAGRSRSRRGSSVRRVSRIQGDRAAYAAPIGHYVGIAFFSSRDPSEFFPVRDVLCHFFSCVGTLGVEPSATISSESLQQPDGLIPVRGGSGIRTHEGVTPGCFRDSCHHPD
jgi:hypothetical protein